ncbi:hypothetical protein RFI_33232, partial [Reticulomyxa filosa]
MLKKKSQSKVEETKEEIETNRKQVIIGYCCDDPGDSLRCKPQRFVRDLTEGVFAKDWDAFRIVYQQCTQSGQPPKWTYNYSAETTSTKEQRRSRMLIEWTPKKKELWYRPDLMLCQGYFYHENVVKSREEAPEIVLNETQIDFAKDHGLLLSHSKKVKVHQQRPFLTTYNTEPWGGGYCNRYDVVMDSVRYPRFYGCLGIY